MNKLKLLISTLVWSVLSVSAFAQAVVPCDTSGLYVYERQQAAINQQKACAIVVKDTASQQLQCYYQQLATYWQQIEKDKQQVAKDAQQKLKEAQQVAFDKILADRLMALENNYTNYDELDAFCQVIIPLLGERCKDVSDELKRIHTNRSGGGDGTNPGGHGNINGFDNPGFLNKKK